ncbi:positive effector protein gcn20 [Malassezia pachydermatis]|uniref:Positive effector protein gcn20 n=1 Tax=Malassezia pachydermatis TaxID=77020 RepID=A0A0M8MW92_9BASI|nr:positive effector protein gcn20 [Malassezia pachydermatis]KOS15050.1 positive effector protein gcn20 [Malassezia pachydermatis]
MAAAALLREALPSLDEPIVVYLDRYIEDAGEDPTVNVMSDVVEPMLKSAVISEPANSKVRQALPALIEKLAVMVAERQPETSAKQRGLTRLDKVVDMSSATTSSTMTYDAGNDSMDLALGKSSRNRTTVDVKKLERQEAKTRAKLAKRAQRDLYESSKLVENVKKMASYEEMYMQVNPLESISAGAAKGKNKDIHLPNIDVSFGSHRILTNAELTMAYGRRYGLVGRNGVGKSTLLRHMAMRDVPIPTNVSLLYVEQEIVGDDTPALDAVLKADVWREKLMAEEKSLNAQLQALEEAAQAAVAAADENQERDGLSRGSAVDLPTRQRENQRDELLSRLGDVQAKLVDMEAETGPSRAATLLNGLGIVGPDQQKPTKAFSGGWRMRLALARALFCKPDLLMLDEPSNMLDLNAIAWLEDYLVNEWSGTLLVVSHDRAFLNQVATDIVHMHSERLDYYKGNFDQFYETRDERRKNQIREYEANMQKRAHLQAFIDRWRYNANRAAQAQSRIKELERLPILEPPEKESGEHFTLPETEKISPPLLQLDNVTFGYSKDKIILNHVNFDVTMDSRIALIGSNGAGKSTLIKLLINQISPLSGDAKRNPRLRVGYFSQHHIDQLDLTMSAVAFLASRFPGRTEQEYRQHLGSFGITGTTGLQKIATLSGGQKSRVAFAQLSLMKPHVLLLDEPTNHLDIEALDALIDAINRWNGGVIVVSHDERFINSCLKEMWVCDNGTVYKFQGNVSEYKRVIVESNRRKLEEAARASA